MARVGYARVSTSGQSLEVQLEKLEGANCDPIFQEKCSGETADRPQYRECMKYLRQGDTLVVTRLDRLARSVSQLAKISERFQSEGIHLLVLDQSIDTSTSTGRLMFNMLATIAEFENDLRRERQTEGIAKARKNGTKFGRPVKITDEVTHNIQKQRAVGVPIGQLVKNFGLSQATIYRALRQENTGSQTDLSPQPRSSDARSSAPENSLGSSGGAPRTKTTQVKLKLNIGSQNGHMENKANLRAYIEETLLLRFKAEKASPDGREYLLNVEYQTETGLHEQMEDLISDMHSEADYNNSFLDCELTEVGTARSW
ncbi:recombinase family protein [Roseibium sp. RKSG952]|uniref:recombinase family protein n=1 Tax=Roseibium sp. RKSG952 TaxID=2529384 RepID=UPI0012BD00FE|nr:recombinase family protein [Roseibium sp. RKSG952]MTH94792.1 recombinase family protein [Roseibium sp. RKSG952]